MLWFAEELDRLFREALQERCQTQRRSFRWEDVLDERTKQAIHEWRVAFDVEEQKHLAAEKALESFLKEHWRKFPVFEMAFNASQGNDIYAEQTGPDCDPVPIPF